ncbi:putative beta-lysine N-acetyltransferase [Brevibacillus fulvus]|uniref:Beta-lysine N-acetyltransferase n=1 Tax=Brevibacillus fulvus TaxID=1125967 RepID=A0A939BN56_9BACL|nr:putative beta-lysine N-acetyltransferase [Brevibacillus fulvus]MBM7588420.1 putative beta-lysine N-acetyltransferase [Brevibacillus fulvus]
MNVSRMIERGELIIDRQNQRIKLFGHPGGETEAIHQELCTLAKRESASKLIVYARKAEKETFVQTGYREEGRIDGFYAGENAYLLSWFLTEERAASAAGTLADEIMQISLAKSGSGEPKSLPNGYRMRAAHAADAEEMARLYKQVFSTYPTPLDDPAYIRQTMNESTYYFVIEWNDAIVCAASAEVSRKYRSAELTDCVTHPDHLGNSLMQPLFTTLQRKMEELGIYYLYTLTRALSLGMNVTAAKHGYQYRGRLINNCTIFSGFEDMNIWVKPLKATWE